jgi:hypothetical protein
VVRKSQRGLNKSMSQREHLDVYGKLMEKEYVRKSKIEDQRRLKEIE